jgi:hypothetical protein
LGRVDRIYILESNIEKFRLITKLLLPKRLALGIEADILFAGSGYREAQKDCSGKPDPSEGNAQKCVQADYIALVL